MINLGSVDNASDVGKPVSTATQASINLKANAADVASNFEIDAPLLWYFVPANPTDIHEISLDLNNIAHKENTPSQEPSKTSLKPSCIQLP